MKILISQTVFLCFDQRLARIMIQGHSLDVQLSIHAKKTQYHSLKGFTKERRKLSIDGFGKHKKSQKADDNFFLFLVVMAYLECPRCQNDNFFLGHSFWSVCPNVE